MYFDTTLCQTELTEGKSEEKHTETAGTAHAIIKRRKPFDFKLSEVIENDAKEKSIDTVNPEVQRLIT